MPKPKPRPLVFISHVTTESEIAKWLKDVLASGFLGMIDFFVSSDNHSIAVGDKWLDGITEALHRCVIQLVICSPVSIGRSWVNFEAGAGWVRDIPVVPVCHSGLSLNALPVPWNALQATDASDPVGLASLVRRLADALEVAAPDVDFGPFIRQVREFERSPTRVRKAYEAGADIHGEVASLLTASKKRILGAGVHFNICLSDRRQQYLNMLASGVDVTLAMLDPDCEALDLTAHTFNMTAGELRSECRTGLEIMRAFSQQYERARQAGSFGRLELLVCTRLPRARFYVFDDELPTGYVLFTPYVYGLRSSESPSYGIPMSDPAAKKYVLSCMNTLELARPLSQT
jgi:hypothetical protein